MNNWKIEGRITVEFSNVLAVMGSLGPFVRHYLDNIEKGVNLVEARSMPTLEWLAHAKATLKEPG